MLGSLSDITYEEAIATMTECFANNMGKRVEIIQDSFDPNSFSVIIK